MKRYTKEAQQINHLLTISENLRQETDIKDLNSMSRALFGTGTANLSFVGSENYETFTETIKTLYQINKEVVNSYTVDDFQNRVVNLLRRLRDNEIPCSEEQVEAFYKALLESELVTYEIFYPIYGITLKNPEVQLGIYKIYKMPDANNLLMQVHTVLSGQKDIQQFSKSQYWISVNIAAREPSKALELSSSFFEMFEHIINYVRLDPTKTIKLSLFKSMNIGSIDHIICSGEFIGNGSVYDQSTELNLEDSFLKDVELGNDRVWDLTINTNKTDLESRILSAVQWIGKGANEKDPAKSLVQFVFAIEGMFQNNENTIFTPSILSSISENLAFLIGSTIDQRKEVVASFKEVYKNRSAIAHGSTKTITQDNLIQAHRIACLMVISFLTKLPFNTMISIKEFNAYIQELKFG
jgi:hypothetical protein